MSGNTSSTSGYLTPTSPLPADDDVLSDLLHDFVAGVTGLAPALVFPRWQPQPPTMPPVSVNWAAVGVTTFDPTGYWTEMVHFDGYSVQREHQTFEVLAIFYGPASNSIAALFLSGMTVRQNLEVLGTFGIKLQSKGNITHAPELVNTQYVARSDVAFRLIREIDRTYNILNVVEAEVTLVNDTGYVQVAEVDATTFPP